MDYKAVLNKKVAGVPVYLIALLFAGGLLYMALRMKPATDSDTPMEEGETVDEIGGDVADIQQPVFTSPGSGAYMPTGGGSVTAIPVQDTNELWGRRVTEGLLQAGYSYSVVSGTVSKYLSGTPLTAEEIKIRDLAIRTYGIPPEGVEYAPDAGPDEGDETGSGPAVRQGTPPCNHTVAGKNDDTPVELSRLYYGVNNADSRAAIDAANSGVSWPANIGDTVKIPVYVPADNEPDEPTPNVPDPPTGGGGQPHGTDSIPGISNRTEWERSAKGYLKKQGHDAERSQRAIERYLAGQPLTDNQKDLVREAINRHGKPPENEKRPESVQPTVRPVMQPVSNATTKTDSKSLGVLISQGNPIKTPSAPIRKHPPTVPGVAFPVKRGEDKSKKRDDDKPKRR